MEKEKDRGATEKNGGAESHPFNLLSFGLSLLGFYHVVSGHYGHHRGKLKPGQIYSN